MVEKKRGSWATLSLVMALALAATGPSGIQTAYADDLEAGAPSPSADGVHAELSPVRPGKVSNLQIAGCDHLITSGGEGTGDEVDILTVTGKMGDTVYINMADGEKTIASHLAFTLDDNNAETDANGDMVGVVSVSFNSRAFSYKDTYTISVYADRDEAVELYNGTVSTAWASCGGSLKPIVVRTLGKNEERPFSMPETLIDGNMMYSLVDSKPEETDGLMVYAYEESKDAPESVDGHVKYYDTKNPGGEPVRTDEIVQLSKGESREVSIPDVISATDGTLYRTLQLSDSVTAAYPGSTEFSVMCQKLDGNWGKEGSFFTARIQYVNAEGAKLDIVDSVLVNKRYLYTPPTLIYIRGENGVVQEYKLSSSNPGLNDEGVLVLEPGMAEGVKNFDIVYEPVADDEERTWTVILENGSLDPTDPARVIDRITYRGKPGETVTHETKRKIVVDNVDYVPVGIAEKAYEHTFANGSMEIEQVIYYVPDGYVPPEAYDVTVNYVNIATNEVITSESYTAFPNMRHDLEIESPESFSHGGIEWVRLAGQEMAIRHSFYAGKRTYVVYYRDINDDLHEKTVISTVNITYVDEKGDTITRPTTVVDDGTTTNYTSEEVDGVTRYTGRTTENVDGGTTYTDGGETNTVTDGGTTTRDNGTTTTTTDGGTTYTDGGTTTTDGGTTYTDGGTTTTNGGTTGNGGTNVVNGGTTTTDRGTTTTYGGTNVRGGGTTGTDGGTGAGAGTTGADAGNATAGGGANATGTEGTATGLQTGRNLYSVSGPNGESSSLVGDDGRDTATMRIDDDVTPLAGPEAENAASRTNNLSAAAIAGVLAALAGLSALFFFVYKRRKKDEEDSSDETTNA